jgi:DNA polymerase-3 subunit beta
MKFTINSSELSKALDRVIKFVPGKPLMPILANIKLVTYGTDTILISAFDLSNGIELKLLSEILDDGDICVPAQSFAAIVKGMAGQLIIEVVDTIMTISNLSGSCEIQCQDAVDYPDFTGEELDKSISCEMDISTFAQAIKLGGSSVSTDETKSVLQGVNIIAADGLLTVASTDGHTLKVCKSKIDESINIPPSTIPLKPLASVSGEGKMTLSIDEATCQIDSDGSTLTCRPFAGKYPDYQLLLPTTFTRTTTIDRSQLIDALNLMASVGSENSLVKFVFENDNLIVMSAREGIKGQRSIDCKMSGHDFENYEELEGQLFVIAFNLKYLLSTLKVIPTQKVLIQMNAALQPVIIEPVDSDLDLLCLIMPVAVRE